MTAGESGLLKRTVRTASVRASGDVELLRLDRSVFHALTQSHPELRGGSSCKIEATA